MEDTTDGPLPPGDVVRQIEHALARLPRAQAINLYNAGSLFDRSAIPASEWPSLVPLLAPFEREIVESRPTSSDHRAST